MDRRNVLSLSAITALGLALLSDNALGQQAGDVEGVKAASKAFYAALAVLDNGETMEKVWAHTPYVTYVGPRAKTIIVGWDAQKKYWVDTNKLFSSRNVTLSDQHIHVNGNLAWEMGQESGTPKMKDGKDATADYIVTNVYEKIDGRWLMVSHHVQSKRSQGATACSREEQMNRLSLFSVITVLGLALLPSSAFSQQKSLKEQIVGTWTHVSTKYKFPDGKTTDTFGPNAKGMLMLDAAGHVVFINMRSDLPKFASKDRTKGTPEENKAVVAGSFAYFGTYTVNEAERTFTVHYEGTTFPNFDGIDAKRTITALTADELKYATPVSTIGQGVVVEAVWKRAK